MSSGWELWIDPDILDRGNLFWRDFVQETFSNYYLSAFSTGLRYPGRGYWKHYCQESLSVGQYLETLDGRTDPSSWKVIFVRIHKLWPKQQSTQQPRMCHINVWLLFLFPNWNWLWPIAENITKQFARIAGEVISHKAKQIFRRNNIHSHSHYYSGYWRNSLNVQEL